MEKDESLRRLGGWDVIALLLGGVVIALVAALRLEWLQEHVAWLLFFGPVPLFIRRQFFPQLDPPEPIANAEPPPCPRRLAGYAMMVFGGLVMIFTTIFLCLAMDGRAVLPVVAGIAVFALAGLMASAGFRRVG